MSTATASSGERKAAHAIKEKAARVSTVRLHDVTATIVTTTPAGRIVRLSDPEVKPGVVALTDRLQKSPAAARQWLHELGFLTAGGNVTRRYSKR